MIRPLVPFLCCVIVLMLSVGCDDLPGKPKPADIEPTPEQITDFPVLFQQNCTGCHGQNGVGNGALSLSNPVYLAIANDDVIRRATAEGVAHTQMSPFAKWAGGTLTDKQIDILVTNMRSRWAKPDALNGAKPPPYADANPGDVNRGAQAFDNFCASCHGQTGQGTEKGGSIVDPSYLALVSNQNLRTTIIAGRPDLKHPDWRNFKKDEPMSSQQISDVVAWIASHRK